MSDSNQTTVFCPKKHFLVNNSKKINFFKTTL